MQWFEILYSPIDDLLFSGGRVLLVIMVVAFVMWSIVIERYLYFIFYSKHLAARYVDLWQSLDSALRVYRPVVKSRYLSEYRLYNERGILFLKSLIKASLLVGLLGTVVGMISVFDAYALTHNPIEEIAAGIAQAIIPTMAGILVALSGLYFAYHLQQIAATTTHRLDSNLLNPC